jgi:curved DNA-binding protein CbpA
MNSAEDYYAVLEIPPTESLDGIHKAFRRLAKQSHPDHAGAQATARFRVILKAYQVLSDPQQRQVYDEALNGPRTRRSAAPEPLWAGHSHRNRPEPLTMPPSTPFMRQGRSGPDMLRQEVCEFGRIAEVLLSPILFTADLTIDEADFIRLYLSQLIDRYGF